MERGAESERGIEGKAGELWSGQRSDAQSHAGTILLVEDEKFVREVTEEVLRFAGYDVLAAKNGVEAVAAYAESRDRIDLLLTDLILPGINGRDLAAKLKAENPGMKVLFVTGYTDQMKMEPAKQERLLAKPFSSGILLGVVRDFLAEECASGGEAVRRACDSGLPA